MVLIILDELAKGQIPTTDQPQHGPIQAQKQTAIQSWKTLSLRQAHKASPKQVQAIQQTTMSVLGINQCSTMYTKCKCW